MKENQPQKSTLQNAQTVIKETASWLYSVNTFYNKLQTTYIEAFPDLAKPLQSSISQIVYSVITLKDLIKELIVKIEQGPLLTDIVRDLMVYPNTISSKEMKEKHLNRFVRTEMMQLINRNVIASQEDLNGAEIESME